MSGKSVYECLQLQLDEVEMLSSMYPKCTEFSLTEPSIIADINYSIDKQCSKLPKYLDYSLHLDIMNVEDKLELNVSLPHRYPDVEPKVYARSIAFSREQQKELNEAIIDYLSSLPRGELCILSLTSWLCETSSNFLTSISSSPVMNTSETTDSETFSRMWIYSHHIYNKEKRRAIIQNGKDFNLTGFTLPGKPGVICVEGCAKDCDTFFQTLRQMSWKKLSLLKEDIFKVSDSTENLRQFEDFKEISFQVRQGPAREYHMDMGEFFKYLEAHNLGDNFKVIFGFDGHSSER